MKLLLDTHAFIWWDDSPANLSPVVLELFKNKAHTIYLSLVSVWEMQVKLQIGKLEFNLPLSEKISNQQRTNNIQLLPVNIEHIFALNQLPLHHRDPFDRLLLAQSLVEDITLVSKDQRFSQYPVKLLW